MHPVRSLRAVLCKASRCPSWTDPWMGALLSRREFDGDFPLQLEPIIIILIIVTIIIIITIKSRRRRRIIIITMMMP